MRRDRSRTSTRIESYMIIFGGFNSFKIMKQELYLHDIEICNNRVTAVTYFRIIAWVLTWSWNAGNLLSEILQFRLSIFSSDFRGLHDDNFYSENTKKLNEYFIGNLQFLLKRSCDLMFVIIICFVCGCWPYNPLLSILQVMHLFFREKECK